MKNIFSSRWQHTDSSSTLYRQPITLKLGHTSICRGYHQNQLVPGSTDPRGKCVVAFFGKTFKLESYQVMVDPTSTSRLEWRYWDIFTKRPIGLVAYTDQDTFVARVKSKKNPAKYKFGDLQPRRGLSGDIGVFYGNKVEYVTKGEILVEVEPIKYKLENLQFVTRRAKLNREKVHLGSRVLSNEEVIPDAEDAFHNSRFEWGTIRSVIAYNASYHYYWGQMPGLIKALPASSQAFATEKNIIHFKWGLPLDYTRHRILEVSYTLQPGTSVQVTATAFRSTTEVPYTATLVATFADGKHKRMTINGTYVDTLLSDVSVKYGRPYFTRNGKFAPTTTTTTQKPKRTTAATTSTPESSTPVWIPHIKPTKRPRKSTTTRPPEPNPLLRFYPQDNLDDDEDNNLWPLDGRNRRDKHEMQSDQATSKRSPMTESLVNASPVPIQFSNVMLTIFSFYYLARR